MRNKRKLEIFIILFVFILAVWICHPLNKKIKLGLDLKGGMDLLLALDNSKLKLIAMSYVKNELKQQLIKEKIRGYKIELKKGNLIKLSVPLLRLEAESKARQMKVMQIIKRLKDLSLASPSRVENGRYVLNLKLSIKRKNEEALNKALLILRNRIDQFGVAEPIIKREGTDYIRIQLPGVMNRNEAVSIIEQVAMLEFKLVKEELTKPKLDLNDDEEIIEGIPVKDPKTGMEYVPFFLVKKEVLLTGDAIDDARPAFGGPAGNQPIVKIDFTAAGTKKFAQITREHVGERLAIILDGKVQSAPVIKQEITGGSAVIEGGNFTMDEVRRLSIVLRTGALPAPVKIIEERTVGPTLGADSIKMGIRAIGIGMVLVVIFMVIYYKFFGIIADFALLFNLILILAGLAQLSATLTLPGIAGIILTVGMAVDANVIIFERIKEELRQGKTVRASIEAGFRKAFWTIFDANVTTLITAIVLYNLGTGPIRGFAVTLTLGIIASMFTAIFVVRVLAESLINIRQLKTIKI